MNNPSNNPDNQELLVEYQSAQNSAQHHDSLIWNVTNIFLAASLVLFGFILASFDNHNIDKCILEILSYFGIFVIIYAYSCALHLACIRDQKYERCKEIEKIIGFKQHSELKHWKCFHKIANTIISMIFIIIWVVLIMQIK